MNEWMNDCCIETGCDILCFLRVLPSLWPFLYNLWTTHLERRPSVYNSAMNGASTQSVGILDDDVWPLYNSSWVDTFTLIHIWYIIRKKGTTGTGLHVQNLANVFSRCLHGRWQVPALSLTFLYSPSCHTTTSTRLLHLSRLKSAGLWLLCRDCTAIPPCESNSNPPSSPIAPASVPISSILAQREARGSHNC